MYHQGLSFEDEFGMETKDRVYKEVGLEEMTEEKYANSAHAAHVMIYCPIERTSMKVYNTRAFILMQLRFDGHIGFPGGLLEPGETPEEAVAREMEEEMGFLRQHFRLFEEDHAVTHYSEGKDLFLHFFTKDVKVTRFESIEETALKNARYGDEVMGLLRVPLYTMADGYRGFPAFLTNNFVGNSKQQLLHALVKKKIMTQAEIDKAVAAKPIFLEKSRK